jgi:hypothetical protein
MRGASLLLSVIVARGIGFYLFQRSATNGPGQGPPQQQIDVVAIRQRLLAIAQAERQYQATNGSYATLDQLGQAGLMAGGIEQRGYIFSEASSGGDGFTITATPSDPNKPGWPTLEIDQSMQITER